MSDSAGSCQAGQVATVKQTDGKGTLTLTSYGMSEKQIDH